VRQAERATAQAARDAQVPTAARAATGVSWKLQYKPTSGAALRTTPGKTTTVLGDASPT
jgi:hypothetical protein